MCGIVGTVRAICRSLRVESIADALGRMHHRGPDGQGAAVISMSWGQVALGAARLAIVDAKHGHQLPFTDGPSGVTVAYNGEIYNWRALRAELNDGTPWLTECDVEVVARAWARWGIKALDRMHGMFALAVADPHNHTVTLARDRAGEKPLYYAVRDGDLHFASEAKGLPIDLFEYPCVDMDTLEFDCLETTPFRGVRRLGPGELLVVHDADAVTDPIMSTWWSLPTEIDEGMTYNVAVNRTLGLLVTSVRERASAEVPVAIQLSGGLDSAIVQAIARSERLYTVTFPDDGLDNMQAASLATAGAGNPIPVSFGFDDLLVALPKIAYHLDSPATWTAVCQWFMAQQMAVDGIRVTLSGEGADELFGGYARYRFLCYVDAAAKDPILAAYGPMQARALAGDGSELLTRLLDRSAGRWHGHARMLVDRFGGDLSRGLWPAMARVDWHTTMQCLLRMADRMNAAHSIENRAPFLSPDVIAHAMSMPNAHKIDGQWNKSVLREVARLLGVPKAITDETTKRGLLLPWDRWTKKNGEQRTFGRASFATRMRAEWREAFWPD